MMEKPALFVFDLDGVIADTEPLHRQAMRALLGELGADPDMDTSRFVGRPISEFWDGVIADNGLDCTAAELELRQYKFILQQMGETNLPLCDGLLGILDWVKASGIGCGLFSSSERYYVDRVLALYGLTDRFCATVAGDEVPQRKPAPDGYVRVAALAGVEPVRAVALEDSAAGVEAARTAGLRVIGYRNLTSGMQDLSRADVVVDKLSEVAGLFG